MKKRAGRILKFAARWLIALVGIVWVLSNIHLSDRVLVFDGEHPLYEAAVVGRVESHCLYLVDNPFDDESSEVGVSDADLVNPPDAKTVDLAFPKAGTFPLLGMSLLNTADGSPWAWRLLVDLDGKQQWVDSAWTARGYYEVSVPQPLVQEGVSAMVRTADKRLLIGAIAVMPITFLFTTLRWHALLGALGIRLTLMRAFVLNMVGAFYNTLMLGSTGGDVLKAYYAAKQVPDRRTAAVMSVIIDRVIGLLALIILGGSMAAGQYAFAENRHDKVAQACLHVAIAALILLGGTLLFLLVAYSPTLRRSLGWNFLRTRLPMREQVEKVVEVMKLYRQRPVLILWTLLITFPVHAAVVVSAMLAGMAFGLPIGSLYYFIVVPVVVLVGALPISPQGAGVMEAFAFYLTRQEGATVNQAVALTMSIRLVQILWNLVGGIFVLRGGFNTPQAAKDQIEDPHPTATPVATPGPGGLI